MLDLATMSDIPLFHQIFQLSERNSACRARFVLLNAFNESCASTLPVMAVCQCGSLVALGLYSKWECGVGSHARSVMCSYESVVVRADHHDEGTSCRRSRQHEYCR